MGLQSTEIIIIAIITLLIAVFAKGLLTKKIFGFLEKKERSSKRKSKLSIVLAIIGLLLLPLAHIIVSFYSIDIANTAVQQCLIKEESLVGNNLSENLGFFSFIGEIIEDNLRESYTEDIQKYLVKAIEFRKYSQILMYASFLFVFVDLLCLYFRSSDCKRFVLISRFIFTIFIGFLIYSELMLIFNISSTILDAKTYGILSLFSGGDSFGYDILCSLLGAAIYVIPLLILHIIHFKCANSYFDSEDEYDSVTDELLAADQTIPSQPVQSVASNPQKTDFSQEPISLMATPQSQDNGDATIEQLDELLHAGILTEEEFAEQKKQIEPSAVQSAILTPPQKAKVDAKVENNKIAILHNLKSLLDAEVITSEDYKKQKQSTLSVASIPWGKNMTPIEILEEMKSLCDADILTQEEFAFHKEIIISNELTRTWSKSIKDTILNLEQLNKSGILSEEELVELKNKFAKDAIPLAKKEESKISILRNLKLLLDAGVITSEEYRKHKQLTLSIALIPWDKNKSKYKILEEMKSLCDADILTQEEFDFHKRLILSNDN